jgi:hypothetical protein
MVISMDSLYPSSSSESSDAHAIATVLDSSLNISRPVRHRKGSLENTQLDSTLNRKLSGKDFSSNRESGAGVVAEWHGVDIAADFISSDIRRAQQRGKNRAFPVQNIAVTRTPLDMGLVDHIRLAHSPVVIKESKDDIAIADLERGSISRMNSRRGSADDITVAGGRTLRRGSADDIVVSSLTARPRLSSVTSKSIIARSDWQSGEESQCLVQESDPQLPSLRQQQREISEQLHSKPSVSTTSEDDETLDVVIAAASDQLNAAKDATARLSSALEVIEEMRERWNALLISELERLDVIPSFFRLILCFFLFGFGISQKVTINIFS